MSRDFCCMLRIADRLFWTALLWLIVTVAACTVFAGIIWGVVIRIKLFSGVDQLLNMLYGLVFLTPLLLHIALIFVFAKRFMDFIRRPFKKFSLRRVNSSAETKGADRIALYSAYFGFILVDILVGLAGSPFLSKKNTLASHLATLSAQLVSSFAQYLVCVLLTKLYILKRYTICERDF